MAIGDDFGIDYTNKRIYHNPTLAISKAWSYNGNTAAYTDETTDINEATINDVALPPIQVVALGLGDAIYAGEDGKFSKLRLNVGTAGVYSGITLQWQYWNGSAWSPLTVNDGTSFFKVAGENDVTWTPPTDWATYGVNGVTKYWIRCVVTVHNTPVITTAPLGTQGWETTVYTARQLYSWLMDTFDDQLTIDDTIPMTAQTPTEYTVVNGWFIDDESTHFLNGGAIKSEGYLNDVLILRLDGVVNDPVSTDIGKIVTATAANVGPLLAYLIDPEGADTGKWWIRDTYSHGVVANNSVMDIPTGTGDGVANGDSVTGEVLYANIYTLGTIEATGLMYICQAGVKIDPDWWNPDGHIDVLVKVMEAGTEIALGVITVYLRVWTDLYDFYEIDLTAGGRNAVPLATFNDPDNQTATTTVMNRIDIIRIMFVNGELAYNGKTGADPVKHMILHDETSHATAFLLNTGGGAGATGTFELGDVEGTFANTNPLGICSELAFDAQTALFTVGETVKGGTSLATGIVRRMNQDPQAQGNEGILFITDVTGVWQNDEIVAKDGGGGGSATTNIPTGLITNTFDALVNGTLTVDEEISKDLDNGLGPQPYNVVIDLNGQGVASMYELAKALTRITCTIDMYTCDGATITKTDGEQYQRAEAAYALKKASPLGTFAGGTFFGARGVWIEDMLSTDSQKYSLIDALGATQNPPTMATIKVLAMVATNDRVLVCESVGTGSVAIKKNQYTMTSQAGSVDYVQVVGAIADDAPSGAPAGVVRVVYDYGLPTQGEDIYGYTSIDRSPANDRFMISGVTARAYDSDDRAYNPFLDKNADSGGESEITVKYAEVTRYIVTRCRYKGYIPFQVAGSFTTAGITVTAIRTVDGIYLP